MGEDDPILIKDEEAWEEYKKSLNWRYFNKPVPYEYRHEEMRKKTFPCFVFSLFNDGDCRADWYEHYFFTIEDARELLDAEKSNKQPT